MKKIFVLFLLSIFCLFAACTPKESGGSFPAHVTVDVLEAQKTPELIPAEKAELLPEDGILLDKDVTYTPGETVFRLMIRTLQKEKLHFDADPTNYFKAIGNLYAGDCGEMSGWLYTVNGESPTVGAAEYVLNEGDVVRFYYVTTFE